MNFSIFKDAFKMHGYRRRRKFYTKTINNVTSFFVFDKDNKSGRFSIKALVMPDVYGKKVNFEQAFAVTRLNPALVPKNVEESYQYKNISLAEFENNMQSVCNILEEYILPLFDIFPLTNKSYWDSYICPDIETLSNEQIEKMCQDDLIYNIALMEINHQKNYHKAWLLMQSLFKYKKEELSIKEKKLYQILLQYEALGYLPSKEDEEELEDLIRQETFEFIDANDL